MPEGRRPSPGACEKPRAGTFAVARGKRRSAGERACEWRTRQECGQSVRGRAGKRRSTGSGSAMGKRGKSADEPFSVARGSAGRRGRGACEWRRYGKCAGKAVFSRAGKRRSAGERGLRMSGRGKREGKPFSVARGSAGRRERGASKWADVARARASRFRSRGGSAGRRGRVCKWVDGARVRAKPFSVARGSAGRRGRGACEWRTRQEGGQSVRGRAEEAQVSGRTGSANGGRGKCAGKAVRGRVREAQQPLGSLGRLGRRMRARACGVVRASPCREAGFAGGRG